MFCLPIQKDTQSTPEPHVASTCSQPAQHFVSIRKQNGRSTGKGRRPPKQEHPSPASNRVSWFMRSEVGPWSIVHCYCARCPKKVVSIRTQGPVVRKHDQILICVSYYFAQKHFVGEFSLFFIQHQFIILQAQRTKLNFLFKLLPNP